MVSNFQTYDVTHGTYMSNIDIVESQVLAELTSIAAHVTDDLKTIQSARTEINRLAKALQSERISASKKYNEECQFYKTMERLKDIEKQARALADKYKDRLLGEEKVENTKSYAHVKAVWNTVDTGDLDFENAMEVTKKCWLKIGDDYALKKGIEAYVSEVYDKGVYWQVQIYGTHDEVDTIFASMKRNKITCLSSKITALPSDSNSAIEEGE